MSGPEMTSTLAPSLARLAQLRRQPVDRLALMDAVKAAESATPDVRAQLGAITRQLRAPAPRWQGRPDPAALPMLVHHQDEGWRVLTALDGQGRWIAERWDAETRRWVEEALTLTAGQRFAQCSLVPPFRLTRSPVGRLVLDALLTERRWLVEAALGGALIALLSLAISLYSMQVYDRVIPAEGRQTLLVLTLGVLAAIGFEWLARRLRSRVHDHLIERIDSQLARTVYLRFLAVRLDQLPPSVGSLASQLRGYEAVRAFLVQATTTFLVDAPFAIVFVLVMLTLAGPVAWVPLVFLLVSVATGLWHKNRVLALTQGLQTAANRKTGLLVETVEAAEIIKSAQAGWRMLGRWLGSNDEARDLELSSRRIAEQAQHQASAFQQLAYVGVIAVGTMLVFAGELTMGGLIACSVLSGRVLTPVGQLVPQLVQWGSARAALQGLDAIWRLEGDCHGVEVPVMPDTFDGRWRVEGARFAMRERVLLDLPALEIRPGEKIAVLGPVGAGKTTLLRLLGGLHKPQQGRILLDDIDLAHIARPFLAEQIGYLPQDGRLVEGTLRENLLLGLTDPGDSAVLEAARLTGLLEAAVSTHPLGLAQPIHEGGLGLSGGQRQLVNLTRVFLRRPRVWLLDEPTASLDRASELRVMDALRAGPGARDTLVLVTHKPEMLALVERILVVAQGRVVLDGPRDAVLARLQGVQPAAPARAQEVPA